MNIYDIAEAAGVSIATVSRVLNGYPHVRKETRERVLAALKEHNYIRSAVAHSLVSKATRTIGVMALDVRHMHYANISFALEQELSAHNYNVVLCNTGYDREKMDRYLRVLAEKQVDGVVMIGSVFSCPEIEAGIERYLSSTPVVMHNSSFSGPNIFSVSTEESYGIELAIDHFIASGRDKIAFVQDYETVVGFAKHEVYRRKLEQHGLAYDKLLAVKTASGFEGGLRAAAELEARGADYNAVMGCDDITALGIMKHIIGAGRRVPEDVAVIGFNNTVFSLISSPALTAIDNREEMTGITLGRAMVDVLRGREVPATTILLPVLVERDSG